jgi:hypothetical protein
LDKIKLVVKTIDDQDCVDIYINDKRLVEILKEIELQYDSNIAVFVKIVVVI